MVQPIISIISIIFATNKITIFHVPEDVLILNLIIEFVTNHSCTRKQEKQNMKKQKQNKQQLQLINWKRITFITYKICIKTKHRANVNY